MEIISVVNLDELMLGLDLEQKTLANFSVQQYRLAEVPANTYRVYYKDKTYEDIQAENASEARNACQRRDIIRICAFKLAHSDILNDKEYAIYKNAEICKLLSAENSANGHEQVFCEDLAQKNVAGFEILNLQQYSELKKAY